MIILIETSEIYEEVKLIGFSLIDKKCDEFQNFIHARDTNGNTLLNYAVMDDNYEFAKMLVEKYNACPLILNSDFMNAILLAIMSNDIRIFRFLFEEYENSWISEDNDEIMSLCVARNCLENLKYLLEKGFNPNAKYREAPMLIWATQSENLEIVKLLVDSGADINSVNGEDETPLFKAASFGLIRIVEYLLSRSENNVIDKSSLSGYTPIYIASCYGYTDTVKLLLEHGADMSIYSSDGKTALERAIQYGHTGVVQQLLNHQAKTGISKHKSKELLTFANEINDATVKAEIIELINQHEVI